MNLFACQRILILHADTAYSVFCGKFVETFEQIMVKLGSGFESKTFSSNFGTTHHNLHYKMYSLCICLNCSPGLLVILNLNLI